MKDYSKILIFLMLLCLLTSEDCSNLGSEQSFETRQKDFYEELENELKSENLTSEKLMAYEKQSLQMIEDLLDYLNIYSDRNIPVEFRLQAKGMIQETFLSETDLDSFYTNINVSEDKTGKILKPQNLQTSRFVLKNKSITENIRHSSWEKYEGKMEFQISPVSHPMETTEGRLNIILKKVEKQFGEEKELVWQLFFSADEL